MGENCHSQTYARTSPNKSTIINAFQTKNDTNVLKF